MHLTIKKKNKQKECTILLSNMCQSCLNILVKIHFLERTLLWHNNFLPLHEKLWKIYEIFDTKKTRMPK